MPGSQRFRGLGVQMCPECPGGSPSSGRPEKSSGRRGVDISFFLSNCWKIWLPAFHRYSREVVIRRNFALVSTRRPAKHPMTSFRDYYLQRHPLLQGYSIGILGTFLKNITHYDLPKASSLVAFQWCSFSAPWYLLCRH